MRVNSLTKKNHTSVTCSNLHRVSATFLFFEFVSKVAAAASALSGSNIVVRTLFYYLTLASSDLSHGGWNVTFFIKLLITVT